MPFASRVRGGGRAVEGQPDTARAGPYERVAAPCEPGFSAQPLRGERVRGRWRRGRARLERGAATQVALAVEREQARLAVVDHDEGQAGVVLRGDGPAGEALHLGRRLRAR